MRQPTAPVRVAQRHNRRLSPLSYRVDSPTHRQSFFLFDFFGGLCPSKIASAKTQSPWSRLLHCRGIIHRESWITFTHKQSPFVTLAVLSWIIFRHTVAVCHACYIVLDYFHTHSRRLSRLLYCHGSFSHTQLPFVTLVVLSWIN